MKLLTISGGKHPYDESTPILEKFLKDAGHDVTVNWTPEVLSDSREMRKYDALVFNTISNVIPISGVWLTRVVE